MTSAPEVVTGQKWYDTPVRAASRGNLRETLVLGMCDTRDSKSDTDLFPKYQQDAFRQGAEDVPRIGLHSCQKRRWQLSKT